LRIERARTDDKDTTRSRREDRWEIGRGRQKKRPLSEILRGAIRLGGHAVYKFIIGKSEKSERERENYECAGISGLFD